MAVQLAALVWGTLVVYEVRPQFVAYSGSHLTAIIASDIDMAEVSPEVRAPGWLESPTRVWVQGPETVQEEIALAVNVLTGKLPDLPYQPRRYRPYEKGRAARAGAALKTWGADVSAWIDGLNATTLGTEIILVEIHTKLVHSLAAIRVADGSVLDLMLPPPESRPTSAPKAGAPGGVGAEPQPL
jgi:hypothetical protein